MEVIFSAIGSLGFPIVVSIVLGLILKNMLESYRKDINDLSQKYVDDVKEINEKYQDALLNNTLAIEKLTSVVDCIQTRLDKLEEKGG